MCSSCNTNKHSEQIDRNPDINRIHDIWVLKTIKGKDFTKTNKHPILEIYVADKKVIGNDGCNRISGNLIELNTSSIKFGRMAGTKMACPNMEITDLFNQCLQDVRTYKIGTLELIFFDSENSELLRFKKID